jgi:GNAT superfamily N-acetyltransferase
MFFSKKFALLGQSGEEIGAVVLEHLWADVYGIKIKKTQQPTRTDQWTQGLVEALQEAQVKAARQVLFRLNKADGLAELALQLPRIGFHKKHDRTEFRKAVDLLPDDTGSPLTWKNAEQLNWQPSEIATTLATVAKGDPDSGTDDDPLTFIQDFLADPVLTAGLHCIHFGFLNDKLAAMTVVQINPKSGWSRISYMGIAPEFRQQGLGEWVHRYSFRKMKELGGTLYHGGTVSTNLPMIRLFLKHGCDLYQEMEEWVSINPKV